MRPMPGSSSTSSRIISRARKWRSAASTSAPGSGWPRPIVSARWSTSIRRRRGHPKRSSGWSNAISRSACRRKRRRRPRCSGATTPNPIGTAIRCSCWAARTSTSSGSIVGRPRGSERQASAMLRQLAVNNIVLVERLELQFEPGLGVLTGETGAGKSILLDALGLALGARADTALVRAGQEAASVTADIELADDHPALALLADQGVEPEPGEALIVRRTLKSDGGSRAFIGGASVPAGLLRDLGGLAVEIHGQHDDRGLLNPKGHRALLDAFGRIDVAAVGRAWGEVTRNE